MQEIQASLLSMWARVGAWDPCSSGWKSPGNSHRKPRAKEGAIPELTLGTLLTDPHLLSGPEHISKQRVF